jgi:hypothetical protein
MANSSNVGHQHYENSHHHTANLPSNMLQNSVDAEAMKELYANATVANAYDCPEFFDSDHHKPLLNDLGDSLHFLETHAPDL